MSATLRRAALFAVLSLFLAPVVTAADPVNLTPGEQVTVTCPTDLDLDLFTPAEAQLSCSATPTSSPTPTPSPTPVVSPSPAAGSPTPTVPPATSTPATTPSTTPSAVPSATPSPSPTLDPPNPLQANVCADPTWTYLEIHAWWEGAPAPVGHIPHLHAETCVPLGLNVTGIVRLDTRIVLHDTDGTLRTFQADICCGAGGNAFRSAVIPAAQKTCGLDRTCEVWVHTAHDTAGLTAGWHEIRVKPRLNLSDGSEMLTSAGWPVCVRCSATQLAALPDLVGRAWYDHGRDYQNPVIREGHEDVLGGQTIAGTWSTVLRLDRGSGGDPTTASSVWLDTDWHAFDEDSSGGGTLLLERDGPYIGPLAIDTDALTEGRHELILRVEAQHATGRLVALQYLPFVVDR